MRVFTIQDAPGTLNWRTDGTRNALSFHQQTPVINANRQTAWTLERISRMESEREDAQSGLAIHEVSGNDHFFTQQNDNVQNDKSVAVRYRYWNQRTLMAIKNRILRVPIPNGAFAWPRTGCRIIDAVRLAAESKLAWIKRQRRRFAARPVKAKAGAW